MATQALSARSAYRNILRAARIAFQNDMKVLSAARQEARQKFDENRREGVDTPMQIQHAVEVAYILRHNIVQGAREAENEEGKWELRIHEDIERGNREFVRVNGKDVKVDMPCTPRS